jgi:hypothetical protein
MHPHLISSLAAERRRDMTAYANAYRLALDRPAPNRAARRRVPRLSVPLFRVTWTRTSLASAGRRRGRSYVIVISATRTL